MRQVWIMLVAAGFVLGQSGCRCCFLFEPYNDLIDHLNDSRWIFDPWYCPRLDISRAGKPDWCGPINRTLAPCRCECEDEWKRYDEIWLYPPRYPYTFPNQSYPGPSQQEQPKDDVLLEIPESAPLDLPLDTEFMPQPPPPNPPEE